jgi:phage terminase small subunit
MKGRKPTSLHLVKGAENTPVAALPSDGREPEKPVESKAPREPIVPPDFLTPRQRKVYVDHAGQLRRLGKWSVQFEAALASFSVFYIEFQDLDKRCRARNGAARFQTTPNGYEQFSAVFNARNAAYANMMRSAEQLGLTLRSFAMVQNASAQMSLFDTPGNEPRSPQADPAANEFSNL